VTEDEAKTKWCPFAREIGDPGYPASNRDYSGKPYTKCIASACMAFRWAPDAHITLGSRSAIVGAEDAGLAEGGYWWSGRYAKNANGYLHRHVAERTWGPLPAGMFVDHIDGDPLNCRRANLRLVTPSQNAANAKARGGASKHRGVHQGNSGRWVAQISKGAVRLTLGTFDTEHEAAAAYDRAASDLHGEYARLNTVAHLNSGRAGYCGLAGRPA
jgi:hypothetical protein